MKIYATIFLCFLSLSSIAQKDYNIQINDTTFDISLDQNFQVNIDGKLLTIKLIGKDTIIYDDPLYSFKHSKDYKVAKMQVDVGIEQIMLMTAEGSGILIQRYSTMNPSMLNELMLSEITKESLSYGFKMKRKDYKRTLKSGQSINVEKAILTYKDETNIYEIATIGNKDEGILIMTLIMDANLSEQGRKIIDLMWDSLIYK